MAGLNYSGIPSVLREFPINLSYDNLGLSLNLRGVTPLVDTSPFQLPSLLSIKNDVRSVGTTDYARDTVRAKLNQQLTQLQKVQLQDGQQLNGSSTVKQAAASGISALSSTLTNKLSNNIFGDDTELGRGMGTLFSLGVSSATNTLSTNLLKGTTLTEGLGKNVGSSLAGAAAGIAGNLIGKGINSIGGDSMLSRGIGQGVATGIGAVGGQVLGNVINGVGALKGLTGFTNIAGIGGLIVGSGLQAAFGPSHEYGGRYGNITQGMDTAYDLILTGIGFVPGWGTIAAGAMALNKGLSNIFGSTDGMTKQDAILGSAFMPAPVKWLNMWGSSKTGTFNNLSWLNTEKVNSFMGNAFGNLGERFDRAREEAGKVYGTFSQGAKRRALANIDFANNAWGKVLGMADLNEILKIRSQYMSSINNQRYAQEIGGVWQPLARGKYGMKILNNATNHNIGQRLLSGAALIDNKQMILSAQGGTKVARPPRMRAHRKGDESKGLTPEEQEWWKQHEEEQKRLLEEENAKKRKLQEETADKFNKQTSTVMGALTQQANETPFTGLEYQQATEDLRQKKVEKFHEAEKIGEAALMADLAVSAAPLLLRGFRWAFNKAGLLVKVSNKNSLKGFSFNDLPQEKYVYNKNTGDFDVVAPKKEWIQKGENELVPDYFVSPQEKERLIATGISPEEALDIMDVRWINSIEALPGKLRNLGKNTFGDAQNINGRAFVRYNSRKGVKASLNDASTTLNTVFHELGGHGSSLNIGYGTQTIPINMKDILMKIYKHNESLRPQLKPFYQAIKDGNFDLAKNLAKDEGIELSSLKGSSGDIDFKSLKDFIEYMEENLEYSARAIGSNMSNHYGMPNGWNEKQLRDIFTKESVDNLLKNVWNYGVPVTVGGSAAATLYNTNK